MHESAGREAWFGGAGVDCLMPCVPQVHPVRLVLLGPPGVGKGTQADLLCGKLGTCHLSTGDLFRASAQGCHASPAMQAAREAMHRGELVSDELVMSMVRERAACLRCRGGFLLDGIPRTVAQASALGRLLDECHAPLNAVIAYELPIDEIVARLSGRRTCLQCKAVFHVTGHPPIEPGVCDHCHGRLAQRDDDQPAAVAIRMQAYSDATLPLTDYYASQGQLVAVSAAGSPDEILERTLTLLASRVQPVAC